MKTYFFFLAFLSINPLSSKNLQLFEDDLVVDVIAIDSCINIEVKIGIELEILKEDSVVLYPEDLLLSAIDYCSDSTEFIYKLYLGHSADTININTLQFVDSLIFDCRQLGIQTVHIFAFDKANNYSSFAGNK